MAALVVQPIYTLLHLASLYREQRDMSPLWNTQLWQHWWCSQYTRCFTWPPCTGSSGTCLHCGTHSSGSTGGAANIHAASLGLLVQGAAGHVSTVEHTALEALVVQPIYTLLHLASLYREQRE